MTTESVITHFFTCYLTVVSIRLQDMTLITGALIRAVRVHAGVITHIWSPHTLIHIHTLSATVHRLVTFIAPAALHTHRQTQTDTPPPNNRRVFIRSYQEHKHISVMFKWLTLLFIFNDLE